MNWIFYLIMGLLGGLSLFIYGLSLMSDNLTKIGGNGLSKILNKLTSNRIMGIIVGTIITTLFQSSSATTVMVVGLINSGFMKLTQSIGIILGANIGATTTPQIMAFKLTDYSLLFIFIGFLLIFCCKNKKRKLFGQVILGFGLLFFGLKIMSDAMHPLRTYAPFINYIKNLENPFLGLLVGAVFTALIQSSGAATGVFIALSFQGILNLRAAIPLTFGANIGTCITAWLASLGTNREAKRAALAHIFFNLISSIIFLPFLDVFQNFIEHISYGNVHAETLSQISEFVPRQIANANTISKIISVLIFLPFTNFLSKVCVRVLPDKKEINELAPKYLDENALIVNTTAFGLSKREILRMAYSVKKMFDETIFIFKDPINPKIENSIEKIIKQDDKIDMLEEEIRKYLSKLSNNYLNDEEMEKQISYLYIIDNIEHIGDVLSKELMSLAAKLNNGKIVLSEIDIKNLCLIHSQINRILGDVFNFFDFDKISEIANITDRKVEVIKLLNEIKLEHYKTLNQNNKENTEEVSSVFLDILNSFRVIYTHIIEIAYILQKKY
jgi:phosphate:Na+ symporter